MAEVLLSRALEVAAHGRFHVTSAGLRARDGRESPPDALAVAEELGVSLRDHGARRLTDDIADAADLLVIMDRANEAILLSEFPSVVDKVVLLGFWGLETEGGEDVEIPDPYGTGLETVRACYDRIEQSTAALSRALVAQQP